jgi:Zn-finger nucleic acid-binding protein
MTPTPIRLANVTIDVCAVHGSWYDRGELEAVVHTLLRQADRTRESKPTDGAAVATEPRADDAVVEKNEKLSYRDAPNQPRRAASAPKPKEKLALFGCVIEPGKDDAAEPTNFDGAALIVVPGRHPTLELIEAIYRLASK